MNKIIICFLLLAGAMCINAQDKLVLRDGRSFDVKIVRILDGYVNYVYPGEVLISRRSIAAVSYILYENGKIEIFDKSIRESDITLRNPQRTTTSAPARNTQPVEDDVYWEDVKTTFMESDVSSMTRLKRISAVSNVSYRDAIQQLKKKAAEIGGTMILVMDSPEDIDEIEVIGIAYQDKITPQRTAPARSNTQTTQQTNVRRRTAQQLGSYTDDRDLQYEDAPRTSSRNTATQQREERQPARQQQTRPQQVKNDTPDAVYLLNGRIINGIIEEEDDDYISIRIPTGRVNEYSMDDVRRISRGNAGNSAQQRRPASSQQKASRPSKSRDYDDYSVAGYKGIFDVGYDLPIGGIAEKGNLSINTSHGYQLNENFFIGAGLGLNIYNARDLQLKTNMSSNDKFPQYVAKSGSIALLDDSVTYMRAVDSSYMTLPIFLDIRGYLPLQNSAITPFASFRIGYAFNLSDGFGGMGLYMNPAVGAKYQISPMIGINLSLGYSYQSYGGVPKNGGYGYYYFKNAADKASNTKYEAKGAGSLSIKLGVEF